MSERVWVVAFNDGEAAEIIRVLVDQREQVLVSAQGWGASWAALEPSIQRQLDSWGGEVFGVELKGPNRWSAQDIDHHTYPEEDRWCAESALEQVAVQLGVSLTRWQTLLAANDKGYIPAMEKLGASAAEIVAVRLHDRRMQGVTPAEEAAAERDVKDAAWHGSRAVVACQDRCTSAHSDLLYGSASEWLLTSDGTWEYSGPRHREFSSLCSGEETWVGGSEGSGYFGVLRPSDQTRMKLMEHFLNG